MTSNFKEDLIKKLRTSLHYSIQLDENTDITKMTQFLTIIRYKHEDSVKEVFDEKLFSEPLSGVTITKEIFQNLHLFKRLHNLLKKNVLTSGRMVQVR